MARLACGWPAAVSLANRRPSRLSPILCAEALLATGERVLDVKNPAPSEQPESMFHLHLHSLCEVLEKPVTSNGRVDQGYAEQSQSSAVRQVSLAISLTIPVFGCLREPAAVAAQRLSNWLQR